MPEPTPLLKVVVDRDPSVAVAMLAADRHARVHYGGRPHRRLGVRHVDDMTISVYYAQEPAS